MLISFSKNDRHCDLYNKGGARNELSFYSSILKKCANPVFFDIGANIGFFSKNLAEYCSEVHAFEPVSIAFDSLKENTKEIGIIKTNKIGLSNEEGSAEIMLSSSHNQGHTLDRRIVKKFNVFHGGETEWIKIITLENYCKKNNINNIDLLKIDCEGFEKNAILGLGDYSENVKNIVFENYFEEDLEPILNHCSSHQLTKLNINNQPMYLLQKA